MIDYKFAHLNPELCKAEVVERDTYRYTGRTKGGFEMHYTHRQCKHKAKKNGYCIRHYKVAEKEGKFDV